MFAHTLIWGLEGVERKSEDTYEPFLKLLANMHTNTNYLKQKPPKIKRYFLGRSLQVVYSLQELDDDNYLIKKRITISFLFYQEAFFF